MTRYARLGVNELPRSTRDWNMGVIRRGRLGHRHVAHRTDERLVAKTRADGEIFGAQTGKRRVSASMSAIIATGGGGRG